MGRKRSRSRRGPTRGKPRALARGIIEVNARGFGFVKTSAGEFFIPRSKVGGAFDGDVVEVAPTRREGSRSYREKREREAAGQRQEGRVVNVVERAHASVVGRYDVAEPFGIVVPLDPRIRHDIFTRRSDAPHVADGSIVRVAITEYPTRKSAACGVVEEVIGSADDAKLLVEQVIASYKLPVAFSEAALEQADAASVGVEGALASGYVDIRSRFTFTIDPVDARDFDDALSVERVSGDQEAPAGAVMRLGVHIADVTHYVPHGSPLDLEARERATSAYLPDRVIPMLPERLSNGICSLNPGEDRLCMTVDLYLDASHALVAHDIYPAVMRSDARLDYGQAQDILDGRAEGTGIEARLLAELAPRIKAADELARARSASRAKTGGLEFRTKEAKLVLDETGEPVDVIVRQKTDATMLIEEAMVFANEVVARHLEVREYPCAFRDHEPPPADGIAGLIPVFQEFKWFTPGMARRLAMADPHAIQEVLAAAAGRVEETLVSTMLLRSMSRAVYSLENLGHYGLGLDSYCHFTSPIRRYPDLMVHRVLKCAWKRDQRGAAALKDQMRTSCEHCSKKERDAEGASQDAVKALLCVLMASRVGEAFPATISGVASYGFYVELENCAEGLVPVRSLGDEYFAFDPVRHALTGVDTGITFRLGDEVRTRLVSAEPMLSRLTFALA